MSTPSAGGVPRQGILSLAIKDKGALFNAYMPFVKGGGLFVPTIKRYNPGDEVFILPLNMVIESLQPQPQDVHTIAGDTRVLHVRNDYVPLINLREQYQLPSAGDAAPAPIAVIVESGGRRLALEVDELLGQQQVVVKNLEANYRRIPGISGATILGDGRVALIIDAGGIATATAMPAAA